MITRPLRAALSLLLVLVLTGPALAQFTVLDQSQDAAATTPAADSAEPAAACGARPVSIARMSWPSAEILAEIHARLLAREFGCDVRVTPGDLAASASAMASSGQPAVVPEMWVTRIADVWNAGLNNQALRPAAPTYSETQFEGWFIPAYMAAANPGLLAIADLPAGVAQLNGGAPLRFISCPPDWACALYNRNLIAALSLGDALDVVEPGNRFEMDTLIAEAISRNEPVLFYYWQPNAVLAQLEFVPLSMGAYDETEAKCLAQLSCPTPQPSAFPPETVVVALAEWVFTDTPAIAAYFQRSSLPLTEMNALLAQLSEPGATPEIVAERFVTEREDLWRAWAGTAAP